MNPILKRFLQLLAIVSPTLVVDAASKIIAKTNLSPGEAHDYLAGTFRIQYMENTGAFLSLGGTLSEPLRFLLFSLLTGIFLLGATIYILKFPTSKLQFYAIAMLIAGGLGNLIDRINLGRVPDFLNVGIGDLRTGIFNVADMVITSGSILLLWDSFRTKSEKS